MLCKIDRFLWRREITRGARGIDDRDRGTRMIRMHHFIKSTFARFALHIVVVTLKVILLILHFAPETR